MAFNESLFSSLISLVVGTLLGTELSRLIYRPRVKVRYKDIDPNYDESGVYWALQIENVGRTVAKECVSTITLFDVSKSDIVLPENVSVEENLPKYTRENIDLEVPREQILKLGHFRPIRRTSLCWAKLGNPDKIDINPGVSETLDICKYQRGEKQDYFIFPSEDGWRRVRVRLKSQVIKGYVMICPSNEFPTRVNIELSFDGCRQSKLVVKKPSAWSRMLRLNSD